MVGFLNTIYRSPPPQQSGAHIRVSYDPKSCTGREKILVDIHNSSSKPLGYYELSVKVYMPQRSSVMDTLKYNSDYIIKPNTRSSICFDVKRSTVEYFLEAYTGFDYVKILNNFGDPLTYDGRDFLKDAIFVGELTRTDFGLPY